MKNKKLILICGICAAAVFALCFTFLLLRTKSSTSIAFYGIEENSQKSIQTCIEDWAKENKIKVKFFTLENSKALKKQPLSLKKADLLFTTGGAGVKAAKNSSSKKAGFAPQLLNEMTTSMKTSAYLNDDGTLVKALPVLAGNFELSIYLNAFKNSGMTSLSTWTDLEIFLKKEKRNIEYPLIFAGADSTTLLDLLGALTEAFDGTGEYKKAAELMVSYSEGKLKAAEVADQLCSSYNSPLYTSAKQISDWYKNGFLNRDCFNFTQKDINAFMNARLSYAVFMSLSDHRAVESNTIRNFSSIYLPSETEPGSRAFTAPLIYAVPMEKNSRLTQLAAFLSSVQGQEKLSRASGLAPVLSHCKTPDRQADDVRYWLAATNAPLAGLSREADLSKKQKDEIAKELAAKIKLGKF